MGGLRKVCKLLISRLPEFCRMIGTTHPETAIRHVKTTNQMSRKIIITTPSQASQRLLAFLGSHSLG
jgi:hypothetical protein